MQALSRKCGVLPPKSSYAKSSDEPQSSRFSQQRLRESAWVSSPRRRWIFPGAHHTSGTGVIPLCRAASGGIVPRRGLWLVLPTKILGSSFSTMDFRSEPFWWDQFNLSVQITCYFVICKFRIAVVSIFVSLTFRLEFKFVCKAERTTKLPFIT